MESAPTADTECKKPSLDDAIEHARQTAAMLREENTACADEHDQLADWLEELKARRVQNAQLTRSLEDTRENLRFLRLAGGTSLDDNVHMTLTISQLNRTWTGAQIIDRVTLEHIRIGEAELMLEVGTGMLKEVIGGFLIERQRRGP